MSINQRTLADGKTKVWDVIVYQEMRDARGRRKKITRTVKTKAEAIRLDATLKVESMGGGTRDSRRTVNDLMTAWLASGNWSPSTRADYVRVVRREITPTIGTVKLDRLGPRQLEKVYAGIRARGLAPRTVRNVHRLLSVALGSAVRWGWIPANPADRAAVGYTGGPQGRVASQAEVEGLLAAADAEMRLWIRLAAVTGARRSELCALDWKDIDFTAATVTISKALVQGVMKDCKNHQSRTLPLDAATVDLLRQHRGIGPVVSIGPSGLSRRFRALCAAQGIEGLGLHGLRHWCGTMLIGAHDVRTVAGRLGHRDAATTLNVYAHTLAERDRAAAEAVGAALG